jgi:hypothetical protein
MTDLTWQRKAAGWYVAKGAKFRTVYTIAQDHRPGVDFWHLTRTCLVFGDTKCGSFRTLALAKSAANNLENS